MIFLTNTIVIDHDVIGWAYKNMPKIKSLYDKIYLIGKNGAPPELVNDNISDLTIASYCFQNECDLITGDKKSYIEWFNSNNNVKKLIISKFDYWSEGQRPILLIQIENEINQKHALSDNVIISKSLVNLPKRFKTKVISMLNKSLDKFPELSDKRITIGTTHANDGNAEFDYAIGIGNIRGNIKGITYNTFTIRLNPRRLTYFTIGHELTHLVQFMGKIPQGERSADLYTLARSTLFLDEPPCYLKIPKKLQNYWEENAESIHKICKDSLEYKKEHRNYLKWAENNLAKIKIKTE